MEAAAVETVAVAAKQQLKLSWGRAVSETNSIVRGLVHPGVLSLNHV